MTFFFSRLLFQVAARELIIRALAEKRHFSPCDNYDTGVSEIHLTWLQLAPHASYMMREISVVQRN